MSRSLRLAARVRFVRSVAVALGVVILAALVLAVSGSGGGTAGTASADAGTASPDADPATIDAASRVDASDTAAAAAGGITTIIGLVGDSLLFEARPDIERELGAEAVLHFAAWPGMKIRHLHDQAVDLADEVDVLVLVLGTNNAIDGWGAADRDEAVALLDATEVSPCRRWVTITETAGIAHHDLAAVRGNAALAELAAQRERLELVPWNMLIAHAAQYLHTDQVHHSAEGRAAFARAIADAARTCR